ncbi:hypothetical protein [Methylobacterium trifolii]|uniref:Uncharacterized protein n=1 Tax=Methylobacterium trifolii TaxID=1003092 RepID=A0ABQ4U465_9HYPH|nr:hypothetical protein [Methylobacterium trifolii]GJE61684.1 hypothetical protein MPOCJGCO_3807 [Methylobacterium trifolii]
MTGLRRFLTNRLTWLSIAYVLTFYLIARAAPVSTLAEGVRTGVVTLAFMGLAAYVGVAVRAYQAHRWPNEPLLAALGTCLLLGGLAFGGLFQILWRLSNFELFVVNNDVYSFTVSLMGAGIFILITTPNLFGHGVSGWSRFRLGLAWVLAVVFIVGLTAASPDLRWVAMKLKPALIETTVP